MNFARVPLMKRHHSIYLLLLLEAAAHCAAQSNVQVAVIDGHNGKAVTNARVSVNVVRNYKMSELKATANGDRYFIQLDHDDTLVLGNVTKNDLSWNEYRLCAAEPDAKPIYSVSVIMSRGLEAPNMCNKRVTVKASPGEIMFYVTRLPFWERLHLFRD